MKKFALSLCAVSATLAICGLVGIACPASADDEPGLPDGGSLVTTTDGGSTVTVDLGARSHYIMTIRCEGVQSTRYHTCTSTPCAVGSANQLLDYDTTFDIPMNFAPTSVAAPKRYLSLTTDDAGIPACKVQTSGVQ